MELCTIKTFLNFFAFFYFGYLQLVGKPRTPHNNDNSTDHKDESSLPKTQLKFLELIKSMSSENYYTSKHISIND